MLTLEEFSTLVSPHFEKLDGLSELTRQQYIDAGYKIYADLYEVNSFSKDTFLKALEEFNIAFSSIHLTSSCLDTWGNPYRNNLNTLLQFLHSNMDSNRESYQLAYHKTAHGYEMFHDVSLLAMRLGKKDEMMQAGITLVTLCAAFHDSVFTRNRVTDETLSALHLVDMLKEVLSTISLPSQQLITAVISIVIVGGTLPCFRNKQEMLSLFELMREITEIWNDLDLNTDALCAVTNFADLLAVCDVQRTALPELHKSEENTIVYPTIDFIFENLPSQNVLRIKKQLSSDLRIIFESKFNNTIARAAFYGTEVTLVSPEELEEIVHGLESSINFAKKMLHQTSVKDTKIKQHIQFDNQHWQLHGEVLTLLKQTVQNSTNYLLFNDLVKLSRAKNETEFNMQELVRTIDNAVNTKQTVVANGLSFFEDNFIKPKSSSKDENNKYSFI